MQIAAVVLAAALVAAVLTDVVHGEVELRGMAASAAHANHFVVVFKTSAPDENKGHHLRRHTELASRDPESEIRHNFTIKGFQGYAARFSADLLRSARQDEDIVEYIEYDGRVSVAAPVLHGARNNASAHAEASCTTQNNAVWGLSRIDKRSNDGSKQYSYSSTGANVNAYVLDTGVYTEHSDFGGRATWGATFAPNSDGKKTDENGHGTHCAGTIGSYTYGVAKDASIVGVQVLTESGSGSMSGVIQGLEWVCQHKQQNGNKCVINLSLSGGYYNAMNDAANAAVQCGCVVVVAAGNDGANACNWSPASASDVITVGASNKNDKRAYFSNIGSCLDVFGPGVYIKSTWIGSQYAINTISGTSMAAPHVAGVAARLLSAGYSSDGARSQILSDATTGVLSDVGNNSPNKLLYAGSC